MNFLHQAIELKAQKLWEKEKLFRASDTNSQKKFYVLVEFPYPSGDGLHVGHCRSYTALDIIARQARMQGLNVLFPIGFDAFGLPTENYAIKHKINPRIATERNIQNFTHQLKSLGFSFDFTRLINTTDPKYYKWTQFIFLKFLEKGLAYQAEIPINWCPKCRIGLANEEVVNGTCERCDTQTTHKVKKQWMLRITAYAEKLLKDLETVDFLPRIKTQQKNWIGQSQGAEVEFSLTNEFEFSAPNATEFAEILKIRTQNHDHINGFEPQNFLVARKNQKLAGFAGLIPNHKEAIVEGVFVKPKFRGHKLSYQILRRLIAQAPQKIFWLRSRKNLKNYYRSFGFFEIQIKSPFFAARIQKNHAERKTKFAGILESRNFACFKFEKKPNYNPNFRIKVFTTRPDTLFGCTFLVLSPEHPLVQKLKPQIQNLTAVEKYCEQAAKKSDLQRTELAKTKTGVRLKGVSAINPVNQAEIPIFLADYVLSTYGTGAIMSVPAHDARDAEFAQKFKLPIQTVVEPSAQKSEFEFSQPTTKEFAEILKIRKKNQNHTQGFVIENFLVARLQNKIAGFVGLALHPNQPPIIIGLFVQPQFRGTKLGYQLLQKIITKNPAPKFLLSCWRGEIENYYLNFGFQKIQKIPLFCQQWMTKDLGKLSQIEIKSRLKKFAVFEFTKKPFTGEGFALNSGKFTGLATAKCKQAITKFLTEKKFGQAATNYKLRDWVFSRQRYWGEPIPVVHCRKCGAVPLKLKDLPLELPPVKNYEPTTDGSSPLAKIKKWVQVKCPQCQQPAQRETDTMPNWAGSSWYFLRYLDPQNNKTFADPKKLRKWLPVDLYNGGMEHTVLHLLYSRFWHKFLFDCQLVPTREPYAKRISHGMILGPDGEKMSKSRGNVINPETIIQKFGADTLRVYEMFIGPFDQAANWNEGGVAGCRRFLEKVWRLTELMTTEKNSQVPGEIQTLLHQTIQKVTHDLKNFHFNTAISYLMTLVNHLSQLKKIPQKNLEIFLKLLFPIAPHLTEIIWREKLKKPNSLQKEPWPKFDPQLTKAQTFTLAIAVNGKLRATLVVPVKQPQAEILQQAQALPQMQKWLAQQKILKKIFIPQKMLNFVVQPK